MFGSVGSSFRILGQDNVDELNQSSFLNRYFFSTPAEDGMRYYLVVRPEVLLEGDFLGAGLGLSSGEISKQSIEDDELSDRARGTFFLERADLQVFLFPDGWMSLRGGLWSVRSGEGFLVDYPLLGFEVEGDLDLPASFPLSFWARANKVDFEQLIDPS